MVPPHEKAIGALNCATELTCASVILYSKWTENGSVPMGSLATASSERLTRPHDWVRPSYTSSWQWEKIAPGVAGSDGALFETSGPFRHGCIILGAPQG
jgi:hypothetical protein